VYYIGECTVHGERWVGVHIICVHRWVYKVNGELVGVHWICLHGWVYTVNGGWVYTGFVNGGWVCTAFVYIVTRWLTVSGWVYTGFVYTSGRTQLTLSGWVYTRD